MPPPRILVLDGDYPTAISIAAELSTDLEATIVGAGTTTYSRLLRSRHCDLGVTVPPVDDDRFGAAILEVIETYGPDFVLPVGYESAARIDAIRDEIPAFASLCLPPSSSFREAADKAVTSRYAERVGLDVPAEYSHLVDAVDAAGRPPEGLAALEFPLFCKPRLEMGGGHTWTARVDDPGEFWETYDSIAERAAGGDVLVQEYIDGSASTYGCGLLCLDNEVELLFGHEELRSVPRRGGSGTHLRIRRHPHLEAKSVQLLREIGWHGVALVEFKRRGDGSFALMEINPKFWASYALASRHGYRFASTAVANVLDLEVEPPIGSPKPTGEMVFPLRELYFYANNREEEALLECLRSIARPGVPWNVDRSDLRAWLTPPVDLVRTLPVVDVPERAPTANQRR